jgi:hypothetical protein
MVRELIKPVDNVYILNLPDEMIGKTIEVIAFEVDLKGTLVEKDGKIANVSPNIKNIEEKYARYPMISRGDYTFNRDEANDYE